MDNKEAGYFAYGFFMGNLAVAVGIVTKYFILSYFAVLFISILILSFIEARGID